MGEGQRSQLLGAGGARRVNLGGRGLRQGSAGKVISDGTAEAKVKR